jgi:hypothetical protein
MLDKSIGIHVVEVWAAERYEHILIKLYVLCIIVTFNIDNYYI